MKDTAIDQETPDGPPPSAFAGHSAMTSPGDQAPLVGSLPGDVPSIMDAVGGLLVHLESAHRYDLDPADFAGQPRTTLPLAERLAQIVAADPAPLTTLRPVARRAAGTCRDYAIMMCGILRHQATPARVRCGFATYFTPGRYEDHWVTEYWQAERGRWMRADAQLDAVHQRDLGIAFDVADMPRAVFATAAEAWLLYRGDGIAADRFGHGPATGAWFLWVNLARDLLSLAGHETSLWDTWREAAASPPTLGVDDIALCDRIAAEIVMAERDPASADLGLVAKPFWA
ncbi:transglutaminase-like domain-containing protein [Bauldia sp.]|uniref:transglutaminase-like domain-containing protein n=1 Tax=Bauldia sp. TaxID=2575872 RepID=UPI003BAC7266